MMKLARIPTICSLLLLLLHLLFSSTVMTVSTYPSIHPFNVPINTLVNVLNIRLEIEMKMTVFDIQKTMMSTTTLILLLHQSSKITNHLVIAWFRLAIWWWWLIVRRGRCFDWYLCQWLSIGYCMCEEFVRGGEGAGGGGM